MPAGFKNYSDESRETEPKAVWKNQNNKMKDTIELCRDEGSCLIILFHTQVLMSSTVDLTILITTAWNVVLISRLLVSCLCYFVHPPWSHTEVYSEWFIHKKPTLPIKNTELKMCDTRLRHTTTTTKKTTTTECTDKHTLTQGLWIKHINNNKKPGRGAMFWACSLKR